MSHNPKVLTVPKGGTGQKSFTNHGVLIGQSTSGVATTSAGTAGQVLTSNGASTDPSFQAAPGGAPVGASYVTLSTDGTLTSERVLTGTAFRVILTDNGPGSTIVLSTPQDLDAGAVVTFNTLHLSTPLEVISGGTGQNSFTDGGVIIGNSTGALQVTTAGTAGNVLTSNGAGVDPSFQALPTVAPVGATYVTLSTNATLTNERVLTGTTNQVVITDNGAGSTVVLSTPQDIATTSSPTFAGLTLTSPLTIANGGTSATTAQVARINLLALGVLARIPNVDLTSGSPVTLYTFSSFEGVPTKIILRPATVSGVSVVANIDVGIESAGDVMPAQTLTGVTSVKFIYEYNCNGLVRKGQVGDVMTLNVNVPYTATVAKFTIEVLGYEV